MINYSIIVPHKNCTKLLLRLLNSIPERDDLQIIVIDDNSNQDDISNLHYEGKNTLNIIKLDDTEAKGAGKARNVGINNSIGNWLIFADADDTFVSDEFDYVLDKYKDSHFDIIYFNANCLSEATQMPIDNLQNQYRRYIDSKSQADCRYRIRVPWGKIIRRELVIDNNINFQESRVANDVMFSLQIGHAARTIHIDNTSIYNWMVNTNSITSNKNIDAILIHLEVAARRNEYLYINKLNKFRNPLFSFVPSLNRAGYSWLHSIKTVLLFTPYRFILIDLVRTLKYMIIYLK